MLTLTNPKQESNASIPILMTLDGMLMLVRPEQVSNAILPILVTLDGMDRLVNPEQWLKALLPMLVTPPGIEKTPLGAAVYPVIAIVVPELVKVRVPGIQTAYRETLAVPISNVAPIA